MAVLLVVATPAVPVLEVDPEVLDRLALQLREHQRPDLLDERLVHARGCREGRRLGSVLAQYRDGLRAPFADHADAVPVGRHVDGVDRLTTATVPWIVAGQGGVGPGEQAVDLGEHALAEHRSHQSASRSYAGRVRKST